MRKAPLFLMLIATVALVPNAEAKNRDKSWEVGALVAHIDADRSAGLDNSLGGILRFGYNFTSKVEAEFSYGFTSTDLEDRDVDFVRAVLQVTGNFLTDREIRTVPYLSAGIGFIQETRKAFTDDMGNEVIESFDSSAVLTIGAGARSFFNDNWGLRYEVSYNHHDSFEEGQDEYQVAAGITWVVGGQK